MQTFLFEKFFGPLEMGERMPALPRYREPRNKSGTAGRIFDFFSSEEAQFNDTDV